MVSFQPEGVETIENLNEKDDFECGNCLKKYKRKGYFEKHITADNCRQSGGKVEKKSKNEKTDESLSGDVSLPVLKQFDVEFDEIFPNGATPQLGFDSPPPFLAPQWPEDQEPICLLSRIFL